MRGSTTPKHAESRPRAPFGAARPSDLLVASSRTAPKRSKACRYSQTRRDLGFSSSAPDFRCTIKGREGDRRRILFADGGSERPFRLLCREDLRPGRCPPCRAPCVVQPEIGSDVGPCTIASKGGTPPV